MPRLKQLMLAQNVLEFFPIERALLDESPDVIVIPGASDLEADGGEVFRGENARRNSVDIALDGPGRPWGR